jgi:hypothetical protein
VPGEVLGFRAESSIRAGEQQVVGKQRVQCRHIGAELCRANPRFEVEDLGIGRANENCGE